jgi:hypothetical protein
LRSALLKRLDKYSTGCQAPVTASYYSKTAPTQVDDASHTTRVANLESKSFKVGAEHKLDFNASKEHY